MAYYKSSEKGMMNYCCRCDEKIFRKYTGTKDTDGGYTTWDTFEKLPDEWLYETEFGYLCPKCARGFRILMTNFFGENVIDKWKIATEEKI